MKCSTAGDILKVVGPKVPHESRDRSTLWCVDNRRHSLRTGSVLWSATTTNIALESSNVNRPATRDSMSIAKGIYNPKGTHACVGPCGPAHADYPPTVQISV